MKYSELNKNTQNWINFIFICCVFGPLGMFYGLIYIYINKYFIDRKNLSNFFYVPDENKKHKLDFEHRCCFRHQIEHIGKGIIDGHGEIVQVAMKSGKIALYRLTSERYNSCFTDTGQKNWYFHFLRYES